MIHCLNSWVHTFPSFIAKRPFPSFAVQFGNYLQSGDNLQACTHHRSGSHSDIKIEIFNSFCAQECINNRNNRLKFTLSQFLSTLGLVGGTESTAVCTHLWGIRGLLHLLWEQQQKAQGNKKDWYCKLLFKYSYKNQFPWRMLFEMNCILLVKMKFTEINVIGLLPAKIMT